MNKFLKTMGIAALAVLVPTGLSAQTKASKKVTAMVEHGLQSITVDAAKAHVYFLADDALEGRRAGANGSKIAAQYIISQMRLCGIKPLGDSYLQHFSAYNWNHFKKRGWYVETDSVAKITAGEHRRVDMANVLGVIPGRKSDEYVVVGAHLDHEGVDNDLVGDKIYNGADDNASGVSAVLQIMKAFVESGAQPERTVIFAFWDGEEMGLLGSRYFVQAFPHIDKVKGYLNFDMVGGNNKPENPAYMVYFYTATHPAFGDWLKADITKYGLDLDPSYRAWDNPVGGSDQGSFAKKNIPIVWYHTDAEPNYNHPTDEADRINYDKLADITRASYLTTWHLSNVENY